jgi:hypothetical protein
MLEGFSLFINSEKEDSLQFTNKRYGISKNFRELKKDRKSFCEKNVRYV